MIDMSHTGYGACNTPPGMEGWHFGRIEYGGHAEDCIAECEVWYPPALDVGTLEKIWELVQAHPESMREIGAAVELIHRRLIGQGSYYYTKDNGRRNEKGHGGNRRLGRGQMARRLPARKHATVKGHASKGGQQGRSGAP